MATFYLINANVTVGGALLKPGTLINDAVQDAGAIRAAGGLLWPSTDKVVAAAAARALSAHTQRGANDQEMEAIMQAAVQAVQLAQAQGFDPTSLAVQHWWWDPAGTNGGVDTNDGRGDVNSGPPTRTFKRIADQWGKNVGILNPGAGLTVVVHQMSDGNSADPISFELAGLGPSVSLLFQGSATTIFGPSTFTAVTAKNRTTNQALEVTDATINWGTFIPQGGTTPGRVRDITNGSIFHIAKNIGAGVGRMSEPFTASVTAGGLFPMLGNSRRPAAPVTAGDSYVVEALTNTFVGECFIAGIDTTGGGGPGANGNANNVGFQNLALQPAGSFSGKQTETISVLGGVAAIWHFECISFLALNVRGDTSQFLSVNSAVRRGAGGVGGSLSFLGGCIYNLGNAALEFLTYDLDVICQGISVASFSSGTKVGTCGVFDVASGTGGPNNPPADALHVMPGGSVSNLTFRDATHQLWGSGNFGAGVGVAGGGEFAYQTNIPSVTGTGGDFTLGGTGAASATIDSTGASPVFTTFRASTWANLAATIAGGGFGGNVHNFEKGAGITAGVS